MGIHKMAMNSYNGYPQFYNIHNINQDFSFIDINGVRLHGSNPPIFYINHLDNFYGVDFNTYYKENSIIHINNPLFNFSLYYSELIKHIEYELLINPNLKSILKKIEMWEFPKEEKVIENIASKGVDLTIQPEPSPSYITTKESVKFYTPPDTEKEHYIKLKKNNKLEY